MAVVVMVVEGVSMCVPERHRDIYMYTYTHLVVLLLSGLHGPLRTMLCRTCVCVCERERERESEREREIVCVSGGEGDMRHERRANTVYTHTYTHIYTHIYIYLPRIPLL